MSLLFNVGNLRNWTLLHKPFPFIPSYLILIIKYNWISLTASFVLCSIASCACYLFGACKIIIPVHAKACMPGCVSVCILVAHLPGTSLLIETFHSTFPFIFNKHRKNKSSFCKLFQRSKDRMTSNYFMSLLSRRYKTTRCKASLVLLDAAAKSFFWWEVGFQVRISFRILLRTCYASGIGNLYLVSWWISITVA